VRDRWAQRALDHVRHLSLNIGPRGSTTSAETEAAAYAWGVLDRLELTPQMQRFKSAISAWRPFALAATLGLLALALYPLGGRATAGVAAAIAAVALVSSFLELNFWPNPLRWLLPKRVSQNVWAVLPASGAAAQRVVVVGHLDSHRTPFIFGSAARLKLFGVLVVLAFLSFAALTALYLAGAFVQEDILYQVSLAPAFFLLVLLVMSLQADMSPYTHGANDNATGAAVVLALAERLKDEPLANTEVWALNSGCEEVGLYGAAAFVREYREKLRDACFIPLDSVGGPGAGPCFITREGMVQRYHSDPGLVALCREVAAQRPELGAYPAVMKLAYTEGAIGVRNGLRTLTFVNLTPAGELPHWHQPSDVFENVDPDVLSRTSEFLWELLQRVDGR
jgi:hypothetical protein